MEKLKRIISFLGLLLIIILIICGNINNGILLAITVFISTFIFVKKIPIKNFTLFLIIFSLITKFTIIFFMNTPIESDFALMFDTARSMINNGLTTPKINYFNVWGYQMFHVLYEVLVLKIWNSPLFLKILNVIYHTISTYLIYKIVKKLTNENTARVTSLLYSLTLYPLYLNTILGNQQLSLMLILLAIYLIITKEKSTKLMFLIGFLIALGHLERSEGIIYLLTIILYLIITNTKFIDTLKYCLILVLTFLTIINGASYLVLKFNINNSGLKNTCPEWKFLLGFNYNTYGSYDHKDTVYLENQELLHEEVINRIKKIDKWPMLFYQKINKQFLYSDYGNSFNNELIKNYTKYINMLVIISIFIGLYKKKNLNSGYYLFIINIGLFFGAYMLIEVATRYYYMPEVTIYILSSLGIDRILKNLNYQKILTIFRD